MAVPAAIVLGVLLVYPSLFVQGTGRILNYRRAYSPPAPFEFIIENKKLQAFRNEDFKLEVRIEGKALPNEIIYPLQRPRAAPDQGTGQQQPLQLPISAAAE